MKTTLNKGNVPVSFNKGDIMITPSGTVVLLSQPFNQQTDERYSGTILVDGFGFNREGDHRDSWRVLNGPATLFTGSITLSN